ncbi:hypothetical protein [Williamsia sp.]|uniref:hypothetical protein n=1 Tax=Williamsia sp. TaxID=1872085 RepID=UPI002F94EB69
MGIERYFVWPVKVQRRLGQSSTGGSFEAEDGSIRARIKIKNEVVTTVDGKEATSVASVKTFVDTPAIPVGSKVVLPTKFSSRPLKVIAEGVHDSGRPNLPAFYEFFLQ